MTNLNPSRLILLSAGGTGGHMYPAAALSRDLLSRGYSVELVTDVRGAKFRHIFNDIPVHVINAGTLGTGMVGKLRGMSKLAIGIAQSRGLLKRLKPALVVGFGGYPSVPAVYAAQMKGIPTVIHEQNAILGRANVFLATRASRIALSIPHVEGLGSADATKAVVTGNPVREEIAALCTKPYPILQPDGPLKLFIMGGSLGAHVFAEIVPKALGRLPIAYRNRLDVTQQCRPEDLEDVRTAYAKSGIKARLESFFNDVPDILSQCHLVICRSGASTVAEIAAAGRPAIFVPAPYHADQQQKVNADAIGDAGGGWTMTQNGFTEEALLARIETFLQSPQTLFRAAEAARSCGRPDAARRLGNLVTAIASGWDKEEKGTVDLSYMRDG
jgi:UDP-N-acetylglucosamine--N-acetylmuramyl-(pentapeptide) pyrophosphoryl-undecaprenol N-acetylglucosamine transferase